MQKVTLQIVVFLVGAMGMVMELSGVRIMAPFFGASLIVWTNIIGVVLGSLSLGYYFGGWLGDQKKNNDILLPLILVASAISLIISSAGKNLFIPFLLGGFRDLGYSSFIASVFLFAAPSIFFGMVLPYSVRSMLTSIKNSGKVAGSLYALSTLGSIFGTFVAGFFLIPRFGTNTIYNSIAICALILSAFSYWVFRGTRAGVFIILGLFAGLSVALTRVGLNGQVVADIDSRYSRFLVISGFDRETGRPVRGLVNGRGAQSMVFSDMDNDLASEYTKFFRLDHFFNPKLKKVLMLGAGAYSYPKEFLRTDNTATIDVVEIDPKVTEISGKYFGLKTDPRLTTIYEDARTYVNNTDNKYDVIYVDAFGGDLTPPFTLTTIEFIKKTYSILNEDGTAIVNNIGSLKGVNSAIIRSIYSTYKSVFPEVLVFKVSDRKDEALQNIIMVALKSPNIPNFSNHPNYSLYLSRLWTPPTDFTGDILTDDFAPVEYLARRF